MTSSEQTASQRPAPSSRRVRAPRRRAGTRCRRRSAASPAGAAARPAGSARRSRPPCRGKRTRSAGEHGVRSASAIAASAWTSRTFPSRSRNRCRSSSISQLHDERADQHALGSPCQPPAVQEAQQQRDHRDRPRRPRAGRRTAAGSARRPARSTGSTSSPKPDRDHQRAAVAVGPPAPADQPAGGEHAPEQAEERPVAGDRLVGEDDRRERGELEYGGERPQRRPAPHGSSARTTVPAPAGLVTQQAAAERLDAIGQAAQARPVARGHRPRRRRRSRSRGPRRARMPSTPRACLAALASASQATKYSASSIGRGSSPASQATAVGSGERAASVVSAGPRPCSRTTGWMPRASSRSSVERARELVARGRHAAPRLPRDRCGCRPRPAAAASPRRPGVAARRRADRARAAAARCRRRRSGAAVRRAGAPARARARSPTRPPRSAPGS